MGILVGFWHDRDLADDPFVVDLPGSSIGAGPFRDRPAANTFLIRKRNLVVLTVIFPGLLDPGLLYDVQGFLVDPTVMIVDRRAVHWCAGGVVLLAEHIHPAVLVTASKAGID